MTHRFSSTIFLLLALTYGPSVADVSQCKGDTLLSIGEKQIAVEVADTERARRYGLMFRSSMGKSCGMLFVFANSQIRTFTMQNTLIPLDIAFISADGTIKEILTMQPGTEKYLSTVESNFALEMTAGWFAKNALQVGSVISLLINDADVSLSQIKTDG